MEAYESRHQHEAFAVIPLVETIREEKRDPMSRTASRTGAIPFHYLNHLCIPPDPFPFTRGKPNGHTLPSLARNIPRTLFTHFVSNSDGTPVSHVVPAQETPARRRISAK